MARAGGFWAQRLARNPDLLPRTLSGCVMAIVAGVPVVMGGALLALFAAATGAAMAWEYRQLHTRARAGMTKQNALYAALPAMAVGSLLLGLPALAIALVLLGATAFGLWDERQGRSWRWSGPGLAVIGLASVAFPVLRAMEPFGLITVLWIAIVVVATDIGAYAFGRALGGPKLWPRVSPKKTWAGLLGGMLCATIAGAVFTSATMDTHVGLVCTVSAIAALVAQGGDLAESSVKRHFDVKDASNLIPGHGGVLDRLDGFIAATLAVAVTTWLHGRPVFMS